MFSGVLPKKNIKSIAVKKQTAPRSKNFNHIIITHNNIQVARLHCVKVEINKEVQWVISGQDFANILSPITHQKFISSNDITRAAGVKPKKSISFGYGQRHRPLTAYDACQYLHHIIKTYENDPIEINALQFFIQLLTINIGGSSPKAIWKLDLTVTNYVILPHPMPWLIKKSSSVSFSATIEPASNVQMNPSFSTNLTTPIALPPGLVVAIKQILLLFFPSPTMKAVIELGEYHNIKVMDKGVYKVDLRFAKVTIDQQSQWVVSARDMVNIFSSEILITPVVIMRDAGIKSGSPITFRDSAHHKTRAVFLTVHDVCSYLNYIISQNNEQRRAYAILVSRLLLFYDTVSNSTAWILNIQSKESITLQLPMSTPSLPTSSVEFNHAFNSAPHSLLSISISSVVPIHEHKIVPVATATTIASATTTNSEDKNSVNIDSVSDNPVAGFEYDDGLTNFNLGKFDHWKNDLVKLRVPEMTSSNHSAIGQSSLIVVRNSPHLSASPSAFFNESSSNSFSRSSTATTHSDSSDEISDTQVDHFLNLGALPSSDAKSLSTVDTHTSHSLGPGSISSSDLVLSLNSSDYSFFHFPPPEAITRSDSHSGKRNLCYENKDEGSAIKKARNI